MNRNHWFSFVFFVALPFLVFSQDRVFIDYGNCTKGLINSSGDTVLSPQFSDIHLTVYNRNAEAPLTYWKVVSGGEQGLVNNQYELVVPLGKQKISLLSDSIVQVHKSYNSYFCHGFDASLRTVRGAVNGISTDGEYLICKKEDSTFIYDKRFHLIQELPYLVTQSFTSELQQINYSGPSLFLALQHTTERQWPKHRGIVDIDGRVVVPFEYNNVFVLHSGSDVSTNNLFFITVDNKGHQGIQNVDGTQKVIPNFRKVIVHQLQRFPKDPEAQNYAYLNTKDGWTIMHLNSGRKSEVYQSPNFFEGFHLVERGNKRYVLDSLLNPIDSLEDLRYYYGKNKVTPEPSYNVYLDVHSPWPTSLRRQDSVLFVAKNFKTYPHLNRLSYQLRNFHTGKTTKKSYASLGTNQYKGELLYYGSNPRKLFGITRLNGLKEFDILNSNLELQAHFEARLSTSYTISGREVLKIKTSKGKVGIIEKNGDTFIPFEYEDITPIRCIKSRVPSPVSLERQHQTYVHTLDTLLRFTHQGKQGLLTQEGKMLFPASRYDKIERQGSYIRAHTKDSIYTYLNFDSLLIDRSYSAHEKVSKFQSKRNRRKTKKLRKKTSQKKRYRRTKTKYFEVNDTLYEQETTQYNKYPPRIVKATHAYHPMRVHKHWIVDSSGHIVYKGKFEYANDLDRHLLLLKDKEIVLIDSNGAVSTHRVPKKYTFEYENDMVVIREGWRNKKTFAGVYSFEQKKWLYPIAKNQEVKLENFESIVVGNREQKYSVVDYNGNLKLDHKVPYDYSIQFLDKYILYDYYSEEDSDKDYPAALLDSNFNVLIEPSLVHFDELTDDILIMRDSNYQKTLFTNSKQRYIGKAFHRLDNESIIIKNRKDSFAILNLDLEFTMPMRHVNELLPTMDLLQLHAMNRDTTISKYAVMDDNIDPKNQLLIKNLIYWPAIRKSGISGYSNYFTSLFSPSEYVKFDTASVPMRYGNRRQPVGRGAYKIPLRYRTVHQAGDVIEITSYYDTVYSIRYPCQRRVSTGGMRNKIVYVDTYCWKDYLAPFSEREHFILSDTALIPLDDFSFYPSERKNELDSLLLIKLNEAQALGLRCTDIDGEIKHLSDHYKIEKDGIRFYGKGNRHSLFLYYYELAGLWKHPKSLTKEALLTTSP